MGRAPCCDKGKVKRGPWSPEEDSILKTYLEKHGTASNWIALPHKAGLNRCGKSCRLRWLNYLRPDIKHGGFTEEEDSVIWTLYNNIGSRWSIIASQLPGRTDNDVKNYWNTKLKKKLLACSSNSVGRTCNETTSSSNNPKIEVTDQGKPSCFVGDSSTLPNLMQIQAQEPSSFDQHQFRQLSSYQSLGLSDLGTNGNASSSISSSNLEVSSLSSSSTLGFFENNDNWASWSGNVIYGGVNSEDHHGVCMEFMGMGFDSSNDVLLSGSGF